MCDVPSGSVGVILDALWNQSSPSYSIPPTAAACSLKNGDATVSYWSPTTVEPPVPSIGSYPSVASSNQQAFVFSSNRGTCLTPCFCTFDGSCYSPSNYTDFLVTFIPYCDSSGICIMYAVDQTYNPTNNGKAWFSDSGTQTPNLDPRVVPVGPDSPYPETKSFGCNGCDRLRALACPVTSTTDMTTTSSTTTTTTTPVPTTTSSMTTTTPSTTTTSTPTPTTTLTNITTTAEPITTTSVPTTTSSMTTILTSSTTMAASITTSEPTTASPITTTTPLATTTLVTTTTPTTTFMPSTTTEPSTTTLPVTTTTPMPTTTPLVTTLPTTTFSTTTLSLSTQQLTTTNDLSIKTTLPYVTQSPICECNADGFRLISDHLLSGAQGNFAGYFTGIDDCEEQCRLNYGLLPCIGYFYEPNNLGKCTLFQYDANTNVQDSSNGTASLYVKCDEVGQNECDGNVGNTPATSPSMTTPSTCTDGFRLIANNILTNATGKFAGYFTNSFDCQTLCADDYNLLKCIGFLYEPYNRGKCTIFQYTTGSLTPDADGADLYVRCDEPTPTVPTTSTTIDMKESTTTASPTTTTTPLSTTTLVTTTAPTTTSMPTTATQPSTTTLPATTTTPTPTTTPPVTTLPTTTFSTTTLSLSTQQLTTTNSLSIKTTLPYVTQSPICECNADGFRLISDHLLSGAQGNFAGYFTSIDDCEEPCRINYGLLPCIGYFYEPNNLGKCTLFQYDANTNVQDSSNGTASLYVKCDEVGQNECDGMALVSNVGNTPATSPSTTTPSSCTDGFRLIANNILTNATGKFGGYFTDSFGCQTLCADDYNLLKCIGFLYEPYNRGKCTIFQYTTGSLTPDADGADLYVKCDESTPTPVPTTTTTTPLSTTILVTTTAPTTTSMPTTTTQPSTTTLPATTTTPTPTTTPPVTTLPTTTFSTTTLSLSTQQLTTTNSLSIKTTLPYVTQSPICKCNADGFRLISDHLLSGAQGNFAGYFTSIDDCEEPCRLNYGLLPCMGYFYEPNNLGKCTLFQYDANTNVQDSSNGTASLYVKCDEVGQNECDGNVGNTPATSPSMTTPSTCTDGFRLIANNILTNATGKFAGYFTNSFDCQTLCADDYNLLKCIGFLYEPYNRGKCTIFQYTTGSLTPDADGADLYVRCDESTPTPVPTTTSSMTTILPTTTTIASTTTIKPSTLTLTTMPVLTTTSLQITTTTLKPTITSIVTSTLVPTTPTATISTPSTTMATSITTSKPTTASPTTTKTSKATTTLVTTKTPKTTFMTTTSTSSTSTTSTNQCCQIGGVWSEWSDSGACNDTCGSCGLITRTRTCLSSPNCPCSGPSTRLDNCNFVPCTYPRLSCCTPYNATKLANGTKICGPQTDPFEPEPLITGCMPDCCPAQGVWSQWSEPSGCNDTCGACGVGTRQRYCMTEVNGCPCTGADTQNVPCNLTPCKFPRNSCCIGKAQAINGTIICNMTTSIETPASLACSTASVCCPSGGTWSEWSTSQTCSETCGSCAQLIYTRTCTSEPTCPCSGNSSKTVNCNLAPCLYPKKSCCGSYIAMFANGQPICGPQV
uniref:Apple domain-containing protein n=1 Tax=Acrobeloides nanus TaxID=290746 RepID=A0A914DWY7_9BILA